MSAGEIAKGWLAASFADPDRQMQDVPRSILARMDTRAHLQENPGHE